jgi:hypothetical protein
VDWQESWCLQVSAAINLPVPHQEQEDATKPGWVLKTMQPWHENLCKMLVQGIPRGTIAEILDCTPNYVSMLSRQPVIRAYMKEWSDFAGIVLDAQFMKVVETIGDTLDNGNHKEKMEAARLHSQLTGRIGSGGQPATADTDLNSKLVDLSMRLTGLLESRKMASGKSIIEGEYNETSKDVEDADFSSRSEVRNGSTGQSTLQPAQGVGDGLPDPQRIERKGNEAA